MTPTLARLLTRLYPPAWRERYGDEFEALLQNSPGDLHTLANSVWSALWEHINPIQGGNMKQHPKSFRSIVSLPSAFLPLAMSLVALTVVLVAVGSDVLIHSHVVRDPDEGPAAHIWQLLMTVQMPIVLFFAIKWLRRAPRETLGVLALQAGAWLASCTPVYFLHL